MHLKVFKIFFIVSTIWLVVLTIRNHFPHTDNHSHHSHDSHDHDFKEDSDKLTKLIEDEVIKSNQPLSVDHAASILIEQNKVSEFKKLVSGIDNIKEKINDFSKDDGRTLLTRSSFGGSLEIIKYLVEELGADINAKDRDQITPLMEAISSDNKEVIDYLLSKNADINATNSRGADALTMALSGDDDALINELLKRGANPNHKWNKKNLTHLMLSARNGHLERVKALLNAGADINALDTSNNSALHYSSSEGFLDISKLLLDKGINSKVSNKDGKTAKQVATENNFKAIADLIP